MALALNRSAEILKTNRSIYEDGLERGLENFTYSDDKMFSIFFKSLGKVSFEGVSVSVNFSLRYKIFYLICVTASPFAEGAVFFINIEIS